MLLSYTDPSLNSSRSLPSPYLFNRNHLNFLVKQQNKIKQTQKTPLQQKPSKQENNIK